MSGRVPHDRWPIRAGDTAGYTIEIPFDPTGYTAWKGQIRPAPYPHETVVDLHVDETGLADDPPTIRFYLLDEEVHAYMDGWGGDMQCLTPGGEALTLVEVELDVDPDYTR